MVFERNHWTRNRQKGTNQSPGGIFLVFVDPNYRALHLTSPIQGPLLPLGNSIPIGSSSLATTLLVFKINIFRQKGKEGNGRNWESMKGRRGEEEESKRRRQEKKRKGEEGKEGKSRRKRGGEEERKGGEEERRGEEGKRRGKERRGEAEGKEEGKRRGKERRGKAEAEKKTNYCKSQDDHQDQSN